VRADDDPLLGPLAPADFGDDVVRPRPPRHAVLVLELDRHAPRRLLLEEAEDERRVLHPDLRVGERVDARAPVEAEGVEDVVGRAVGEDDGERARLLEKLVGGYQLPERLPHARREDGLDVEQRDAALQLRGLRP
jgi:hypothetical protein